MDLLILDVFMSKVDGFETLRQIRNKQIAVDAIMVTAANEREALEEALHLGIVDYLVKLFTYDRLSLQPSGRLLQLKPYTFPPSFTKLAEKEVPTSSCDSTVILPPKFSTIFLT